MAVISGEHIVWSDGRDTKRNLYYNRLGERAQQLAERYRPEFRMASNENIWPMPVEQFLIAPGTLLISLDSQEFKTNPTAYDLEIGRAHV